MSKQGTKQNVVKHANASKIVDVSSSKIDNARATTTGATHTITTAKNAGRRALNEMTPTEIKNEIAELLDDLRNATNADDKKRIRGALRRRGHTGGLNRQRVVVNVANA